MKSVFPELNARRAACFLLSLLLALFPLTSLSVHAQTPVGVVEPQAEMGVAPDSGFRLERIRVAGGAELLTIFANLDGLRTGESRAPEVPLVSVLRDTMGDDTPENDRLRYLWMLTYAKPSFTQRIAAAVPFFYNRAGNKGRAVGHGAPPVLIDLSATEREVWNKVFWSALQNLLLDAYGFPLKATTRAYHRNMADHRKAHIVRALAVLSLYEAARGGTPLFTRSELHDIQARLMLTDKTLGGIVDDIHLQRVFQKETTLVRDVRGHNWELLRQRAEAESLHFEPLEMPDGSATHAILWAARPDLVARRGHAFDKRFLNIENPWRDDRLLNWQGYTETRYFDAENRPVEPGTEGARQVQLIPLALYGLDHPKIPILLVDFRAGMNPKRREISRRVLEDVTRTVLSLSRFGDLPYFLSRSVYDFVTGRRGMDVNQPSRVRAYSQLKLLLSLNASLDPALRDQIASRLERVSMNPLENDLRAETQVARDQYASLVEYARRPEGLPARLDRDRRAEMMPLKHGRKGQTLLRLANVLSFGLYTHREKATPELAARMELQRRLAYHERYLREVARSPRVEVDWNIEEVRRSLRFIEANSEAASGRMASVVASIFARTEDETAREICLSGLYRINNETAKKELLSIYNNQQVEARWRGRSAEYLRMAVRENQMIAPSDAKTILSVVGQ
ncbi:MAG TPA: hypothetical protein VGX92_11265 [Pyrinomonadaceae bacterium]|jgi:hypothetical protein|nr:hypothetical protein [Pyrinomonadaceae bacterium]